LKIIIFFVSVATQVRQQQQQAAVMEIKEAVQPTPSFQRCHGSLFAAPKIMISAYSGVG